MNKTSSNRNICQDDSSICNSKESILISGSLRNDLAFVHDVPEVLASDCRADQQVQVDDLIETSEKCAAQITFKLQITRDSDVTWESILFQQNLYIRIDGSNPAISKMGFLGIMEYAEDVLKVKRIVVCFGRNNPIRELMVRTFMYIGFCLIPPGHKLIPRASSDTSNIYMAYCTN